MELREKISEMESKKSRNMDLGSFRALLDTHFPEHQNIQKIQVAGTNGKGSTCTWLSLLAQKMGYTTGSFTSPHLIVHNERIAVNGQMISDSDWERIYDMYRPLFLEYHFTMFEMDLWMALVYFYEQKVDIAIIEVGLGGRKDASTALDYIATVLTNIGLEHTEILGDTLEKITFEKCGIFKSGVPAVTAETKPACQKVMNEQVRDVQTFLWYVELPEYKQYGNTYVLDYMDGTLIFKHPYYQLYNFTLACETLMILGYPLTYKVLQEAIDSFSFAGRGMIVRKEPLLMLDGAHNPQGMEALVQSLGTWDGDIYVSALKEKDVPQMVELLSALQGHLVWVIFENERAYDYHSIGFEVISMDEMESRIRNTARKTLVCGSLYFVGEVLRRFNQF